jgi:hypothetical protein
MGRLTVVAVLASCIVSCGDGGTDTGGATTGAGGTAAGAGGSSSAAPPGRELILVAPALKAGSARHPGRTALEVSTRALVQAELQTLVST